MASCSAPSYILVRLSSIIDRCIVFCKTQENGKIVSTVPTHENRENNVCCQYIQLKTVQDTLY